MRCYRTLVWVGFVAFPLFSVLAIAASPKDAADSVVITFKDGHQQTFSVADIARIEFKSPPASAAKATADVSGRHRFVGKWTVGDGAGHTFSFTFEEDGQATNNVDGGGHGTWTYVDGEAHVNWDNGWHDAIRKVGMKYQKFAYAPGKSFNDTPANVGEAHKANAEPI